MPCNQCPDDVVGTTSTCTCSSAITDILADVGTLSTLPGRVTYGVIKSDIQKTIEAIEDVSNFFNSNINFTSARTNTARTFTTLISTVENVSSEIVNGVEDIARQNEPLIIAIVVTIILVIILAVLIGLKVLFVVPV